MASAFAESTTDTWSEFTEEFGLPFAAKGTPSYTWGGNPATSGDNRYVWGKQKRYNRKKDITESRLTLVENYTRTTQDWIVTCDAIAVGGDIPLFGWVGYGVSAVAGTVSYSLTLSEYRKGNINMTKNDRLRAHLNWSTGLIPGYGLFPAGFQLGIDLGWIKY